MNSKDAIQSLQLFSGKALIQEIEAYSKVISYSTDEVIIDIGNPVDAIPIVITGCIRIIRSDEEGKEIFLYHLYPGQTCTLSLSSCQSAGGSLIKAIATNHTIFLRIPASKVLEWNQFPEWVNFMNQSYQQRFAELMHVIDMIAFNHMDKQLLHYLHERSKAVNSKILEITHQEIAEELHTHREAISRLLKTLEDKKFVRLARNSIEMI